MRKSNLAALGFVMLVALTFIWSCSKKSNPTPTKPTTANVNVTGYWFGSFDGDINQSILFYDNGTFKIYDFYFNPTSTDTTTAYDGKGTYKVSGDTVKTSDIFPNGEAFTDVGIVKTTGTKSAITFSQGDVYTKQ